MSKKISFTFSASFVIIVISALLLGGLVGYSAAWSANRSNGTVAVEGYAVLEVEPDEFVFYPSVSATAPSSDEARMQVNDKANKLSQAVLETGVREDQLSSSYDVYEDYKNQPNTDNVQWRATYSLTIRVSDEALANQLSGVLGGVEGVEGSVQPVAELSKDKRSEAKSQIREKALADARAQAEMSATELGKELGDIAHVEDLTGDLYIINPYTASTRELDAAGAPPSFSGKQEVDFRVKVTFAVR